MKKLIALCLVIVMLTGCSSGVSQSKGNSSVNPIVKSDVDLQQELADIKYKVPSSWRKEDAADGFYYYAENGFLYVNHSELSATQQVLFNTDPVACMEGFYDGVIEGSINPKVSSKETNIKVNDAPAYRIKLTHELDGKSYEMETVYFYTATEAYSFNIIQPNQLDKVMPTMLTEIIGTIELPAIVNIKDSAAQATFSQVGNGNFANQDVYVDGLIRDFTNLENTKVVTFSMWGKSGDTGYSENLFLNMDYESEFPECFIIGGGVRIYGHVDAENNLNVLLIEPNDVEFSLEDVATKYKEQCQPYSYKEIARNPNDYVGKYATFTGEVIQVQESGFNTVLRVNVTKTAYGYDDTIYITYEPADKNANRILENDIITIYGELQGLKTYDTVVGSSMSIPQLKMNFFKLNE